MCTFVYIKPTRRFRPITFIYGSKGGIVSHGQDLGLLLLFMVLRGGIVSHGLLCAGHGKRDLLQEDWF